MATVSWRGDSAAVAQVTTIQVTAYHASTVYKATINGKVVSVPGTTDAVGTAAAMQAAMAASTIAEFAEVVWTVSTDTVTGTARTPGVPFTVTSSVSGGSGTIGSATTATSSAGPNHVDDAANWSGGAVPSSSDTVHVSGGAAMLYGLDLSAVTLAALHVHSTFSAGIGLPEYNASGYKEYRETYLRVGATAVRIGAEEDGSGAGRIKLDQGIAQATWSILRTGSPAESGVPAVLLKGTHASNALNVERGSVGVAFHPGEVSTIATVREGYANSQATDADLFLGDGCTLTTINQNGGTLVFGSNVTTLTQRSGTATVRNSANVATLDSQKGRLNYRSSGTIGGTALTLGAKAILDLSGDPRAKTVSNLVMAAGSSFQDPDKTAASTVAVTLQDCGIKDVDIDLGSNIVITRS